jgi:UDP-N-acetylglucosamine 2-epimerase (non-hydrolysing)
MEAGNRCFDQNVPEEINRKIVDHISDVNLTYTEHSRRNLLSEGLPSEHIFVTGSPMREVLSKNQARAAQSDVLSRLELETGKYLVLSAHREENVDDEARFQTLMDAVNKVAERYGIPIVFSTHPRSRKRIEERGFAFHPLVRSFPPFGFHDYIRLQANALCVLSDSGTLSEESAMLGFPAVLIRDSTERPEAIDKGTCALGGIRARSILQAMELALSADGGAAVPDYQDVDVSGKVVRIIQGYTDIINERIWRK